MKVSNVGSTRSADAARRKKPVGQAGAFAEHLKEAAESGEVAGPAETGAIAGVDGMLAAQEVPDALDERSRKQSVDRGAQLLDRLDSLRLRLLEGAVPKDQLGELARLVRARKRAVEDPQLRDIIDEIELRVEVEIAKLARDARDPA
jgi:hypothetical protein